MMRKQILTGTPSFDTHVNLDFPDILLYLTDY